MIILYQKNINREKMQLLKQHFLWNSEAFVTFRVRVCTYRMAVCTFRTLVCGYRMAVWTFRTPFCRCRG